MKKKGCFMLTALVIVLLSGACDKQRQKDGVVHFSVKEASEFLKKTVKGQKVTPLDVRTPAEFGEGHIKGAINVDYRDELFAKNAGMLKRDLPYLVYCRSGARSGRSLKILKKLGFKKLYHMDGGMLAWKAAKLPVAK